MQEIAKKEERRTAFWVEDFGLFRRLALRRAGNHPNNKLPNLTGGFNASAVSFAPHLSCLRPEPVRLGAKALAGAAAAVPFVPDLCFVYRITCLFCRRDGKIY